MLRASNKKLTAMAANVPTEGHKREKPSVYLSPTAQTVSKRPAKTRRNQTMKNPFPTRQGPSLLLNGRSGSSLTDESDPGHFRTSDRTSGYDTEAQDSDMAPYCTRSGINGPAFRAGSSRPYTYNDDVPDESFSSVLTQIRPETTLPVERGCLFRWIPVRAPRQDLSTTRPKTPFFGSGPRILFSALSSRHFRACPPFLPKWITAV